MLQSPPAPANSRTVSNPFRAADGPSGISKRSVSDESTDVDGSVATKGVYANTSVHPGAYARRGIFMIDASAGFMKNGPKNRLHAQNIHEIVDVFNRRLEVATGFAEFSVKRISVDEFAAVIKAREFVRNANLDSIPARVEAYVEESKAVLRMQNDLGPEEPGWSFCSGGKHYICVNAADRPERQRFTICHELAHILLGIKSEHNALPWWSYAKRPPGEIICDVFAAELLLPYRLFKPLADEAAIEMYCIEELAGRFLASITATGSRFAAVHPAPCAFVLSEQGKVRYASRSNALRDAYAWIQPRLDLPRGSLSEKVRGGATPDGPEKLDADIWFADWERGGVLLEEARHFPQWDQTLTLLSFENDEVPPAKKEEFRDDEEEQGLQELDGNLRWPRKRRRR